MTFRDYDRHGVRTWLRSAGAGIAIALAPPAHADVGGGTAPDTVVSAVSGCLSEADVLAALGRAALDDCFLTTLTFSTDSCWYVYGAIDVEMICVRVDMNDPMAIIEGADRQGMLSIYTPDLDTHMQMLNAGMAPTERTQVQRIGDLVSASACTQGRCINLFLAAALVKRLVTDLSFDTLCTPAFELARIPAGYAFASEGDFTNGTSSGNWRGTVSSYWLTPWLIPFTAVARAMEGAGLCPLDWYKVFCHGGWGTVYPSTGVNPTDSQFLNLIDSAYDALHPTFAPFFAYGPLHLRMGAGLVAAAHSSRADALGLNAMNAQITRGAYIQPLYPTLAAGRAAAGPPVCLDTADPVVDAAPQTKLWMPQVSAEPVAEAEQNDVRDAPWESDQGRIVSLALWPRFTCCTYCAGSDEAPARHTQVGRGFWPQLIPGR